MANANVSDVYVRTLHVSYKNGSISGLSADVAWDVQVDGMEAVIGKSVDAWTILNGGQRKGVSKLVELIAESAEDE